MLNTMAITVMKGFYSGNNMNNDTYWEYLSGTVDFLNRIQNKFRYMLYTDVKYRYNVYSSGYGRNYEYCHTNDSYEALQILHKLVIAEAGEASVTNSKRRKTK